MDSKSAAWYRRVHQEITLEQTVATDTNDTTLIAAKPKHTIFVQRVEVWFTTSTAATWSFEDTTTGLQVFATPANPGAGTNYGVNYEPEGMPLTEGEGLALNVSATGAAGRIKITGYRKPTSTMIPSQI